MSHERFAVYLASLERLICTPLNSHPCASPQQDVSQPARFGVLAGVKIAGLTIKMSWSRLDWMTGATDEPPR